MNFERGISPKESMKIGIDEWLKPYIKVLIPNIKGKYHLMEYLKWDLSKKGINLTCIESQDFDGDMKYIFHYVNFAEDKKLEPRKIEFYRNELFSDLKPSDLKPH